MCYSQCVSCTSSFTYLILRVQICRVVGYISYYMFRLLKSLVFLLFKISLNLIIQLQRTAYLLPNSVKSINGGVVKHSVKSIAGGGVKGSCTVSMDFSNSSHLLDWPGQQVLPCSISFGTTREKWFGFHNLTLGSFIDPARVNLPIARCWIFLGEHCCSNS